MVLLISQVEVSEVSMQRETGKQEGMVWSTCAKIQERRNGAGGEGRN